MPFNAPSFFAGAGTVIVTVTLGFGAGIFLSDAFVGKSDMANKLDQRAADARALPQYQPVLVPPAPRTAVAQPAAEPVQGAIQPVQDQQAAVQTPAPLQLPAFRAEIQAPTQPQTERPTRPEDSQARAKEIDLKREQRRLEQAKRAERQKVAERKRRKEEALRAMVERARQDEQRSEPEIVSEEHDASPLGRLFKLN